MTTDHIVEAHTFFLLAYVGSIRYKDFPTSEEIHDKSKADWFAKCITLLQLLWTVLNIGCRKAYGYPVSIMEKLMLEWVILGFIALITWWKCPQNIQMPYRVPFRDHHELMAMSRPDNNTPLPTKALYCGLIEDAENGAYETRSLAIPIVPLIAVMCLAVSQAGFFQYQWHSVHTQQAWTLFTATYNLAAILLILIDFCFRFFQSTEYFQGRYAELLSLETPVLDALNTRPLSRRQKLATGMGIYNMTELNSAKLGSGSGQEWGLKVIVMVVFVALLSQFARLVIALTAFSSAPIGIYDVPKTWILEALVHVGG